MIRRILVDRDKRKQVQEIAEVLLAAWTLAAFAAKHLRK